MPPQINVVPHQTPRTRVVSTTKESRSCGKDINPPRSRTLLWIRGSQQDKQEFGSVHPTRYRIGNATVNYKLHASAGWGASIHARQKTWPRSVLVRNILSMPVQRICLQCSRNQEFCNIAGVYSRQQTSETGRLGFATSPALLLEEKDILSSKFLAGIGCFMNPAVEQTSRVMIGIAW